MSWKCPHCNNQIEEVKYSVPTTQTEYGNASLPSEFMPAGRIPEVMDYDCTDSGDCDWDGDATYECPECGHTIELTELTFITVVPRQSLQDMSRRVPPLYVPVILHEEQFPEAELPIIKPTMNIRDTSHVNRNSNYDDFSNFTMICKHCFNQFIYDTQHDDELFECPKCNTSNTPHEYHQLLNAGFFNKNYSTKNVKAKRNKKPTI